jgi:hypothetical protein
LSRDGQSALDAKKKGRWIIIWRLGQDPVQHQKF